MYIVHDNNVYGIRIFVCVCLYKLIYVFFFRRKVHCTYGAYAAVSDKNLTVGDNHRHTCAVQPLRGISCCQWQQRMALDCTL